jgi:hypothetical protein
METNAVVVPKGTLCECGGKERVALDCTMKPCKHPKYFKVVKSFYCDDAKERLRKCKNQCKCCETLSSE